MVDFFLSSFLGLSTSVTGVLPCSLDKARVEAVVSCGGGILLVTPRGAPLGQGLIYQTAVLLTWAGVPAH
jgi:hypothetical protein